MQQTHTRNEQQVHPALHTNLPIVKTSNCCKTARRAATKIVSDHERQHLLEHQTSINTPPPQPQSPRQLQPQPSQNILRKKKIFPTPKEKKSKEAPKPGLHCERRGEVKDNRVNDERYGTKEALYKTSKAGCCPSPSAERWTP